MTIIGGVFFRNVSCLKCYYFRIITIFSRDASIRLFQCRFQYLGVGIGQYRCNTSVYLRSWRPQLYVSDWDHCIMWKATSLRGAPERTMKSRRSPHFHLLLFLYITHGEGNMMPHQELPVFKHKYKSRKLQIAVIFYSYIIL